MIYLILYIKKGDINPTIKYILSQISGIFDA